jgi:hypothetical protein
MFPTSCRDYFTRDNLFASATINTVTAVTIDPDGPTGTGGTFTVNCVKTSATTFCAQIVPTGGASTTGASPAPCAGTGGGTLLPDVTLTVTAAANDDAVFAVCETVPVTYAPTDAQIGALVASSASCTQQIRLDCRDTGVPIDGNLLAVRYNGATAGSRIAD